MKKDYGQSAEKLVQALGGKDNITRVFHCMTRLRFYVKDRNRIKEGDIKKLPEISGVNWHQDQFQVIAGNEVNEMYAELVKMGRMMTQTLHRNRRKRRALVLQLLIPSPGV